MPHACSCIKDTDFVDYGGCWEMRSVSPYSDTGRSKKREVTQGMKNLLIKRCIEVYVIIGQLFLFLHMIAHNFQRVLLHPQ